MVARPAATQPVDERALVLRREKKARNCGPSSPAELTDLAAHQLIVPVKAKVAVSDTARLLVSTPVTV